MLYIIEEWFNTDKNDNRIFTVAVNRRNRHEGMRKWKKISEKKIMVVKKGLF